VLRTFILSATATVGVKAGGALITATTQRLFLGGDLYEFLEFWRTNPF